eukprot:jgi/Bigna1/131208/aug1.13_g5916
MNFISASASFNHFSITWPPAVVNFYNSLNFISINIDFAQPECQVDIPYLWSFLLLQLTPLVLIAVLMGIFGIIWCDGHCKIWRQNKLTRDIKVKKEQKWWEKCLDSVWLFYAGKCRQLIEHQSIVVFCAAVVVGMGVVFVPLGKLNQSSFSSLFCLVGNVLRTFISIPRIFFMMIFVAFLFTFICIVKFVQQTYRGACMLCKGILEIFAPPKHFDQDDQKDTEKVGYRKKGLSAFDRAYVKLNQDIHIGHDESQWLAFLECQMDEDLYVQGRAATQEEQRRMFDQEKKDTEVAADDFTIIKSKAEVRLEMEEEHQAQQIEKWKKLALKTHSGGIMWMYSPQFHKFMANNFILTKDKDSELFKNLSNQILEMFEKQRVDGVDDDSDETQDKIRAKIQASWFMVINALCMCLLFSHLVLVGGALEIFVCIKAVGNKEFLQADQEIVCWEGQHWTLVTFSLIFLIIWGLGIPGFLIAMVYGDGVLGEKGLYHPDNKSKYGYIYLKYANQFWYWEFAVLFRKFMLELFRVLFSLEDTKFVQVTGAFLVFCFATFAQFYFNPFVESELNEIESAALWNHIVVLFIGTVFLTEELPIDGELATVIAFAVILTITATGSYIFISVWDELHDTVPVIKTILRFKYCQHMWALERRKFSQANVWMALVCKKEHCEPGGCCSKERDIDGHRGECCCCVDWCDEDSEPSAPRFTKKKTKNYISNTAISSPGINLDDFKKHPEMSKASKPMIATSSLSQTTKKRPPPTIPEKNEEISEDKREEDKEGKVSSEGEITDKTTSHDRKEEEEKKDNAKESKSTDDGGDKNMDGESKEDREKSENGISVDKEDGKESKNITEEDDSNKGENENSPASASTGGDDDLSAKPKEKEEGKENKEDDSNKGEVNAGKDESEKIEEKKDETKDEQKKEEGEKEGSSWRSMFNSVFLTGDTDKKVVDDPATKSQGKEDEKDDGTGKENANEPDSKMSEEDIQHPLSINTSDTKHGPGAQVGGRGDGDDDDEEEDEKKRLLSSSSRAESQRGIGSESVSLNVGGAGLTSIKEKKFEKAGATVNIDNLKALEERQNLAKISIRRAMDRAQMSVRNMISKSPILSDLGVIFANAWIDDDNTPMRDKVQFARRIQQMCQSCFEEILGVSQAHCTGISPFLVSDCRRKRIWEYLQQSDSKVMAKFRTAPLLFLNPSADQKSQGFVTIDGWGGKKRGGLVHYSVTKSANEEIKRVSDIEYAENSKTPVLMKELGAIAEEEQKQPLQTPAEKPNELGEDHTPPKQNSRSKGSGIDQEDEKAVENILNDDNVSSTLDNDKTNRIKVRFEDDGDAKDNEGNIIEDILFDDKLKSETLDFGPGSPLEPQKPKKKKKQPSKPKIEHMNDVAISRDKRYVVGASIDGSIHAWDVPLGNSAQWTGHLETREDAKVSVSCIGFVHGLDDQSYVVSGATDGRVRFWNMEGIMVWPELDDIEVDYPVHEGSVTHMHISNPRPKSKWKGSLVVTAGEDGQVCLFEVVWGEERNSVPLIFDPFYMKPFDSKISGLHLIERRRWPTILAVYTESDGKSKLHTFDISPMRLELDENGSPMGVLRRAVHRETFDDFVSVITTVTHMFDDVNATKEKDLVILAGTDDGSIRPQIYSMGAESRIAPNRQGSKQLQLGRKILQFLPYKEQHQSICFVLTMGTIAVISLRDGMKILQTINVRSIRHYLQNTFFVGDRAVMIAPDGPGKGHGLLVQIKKVQKASEPVDDKDAANVGTLKIHDTYTVKPVIMKEGGKSNHFEGHRLADSKDYQV